MRRKPALAGVAVALVACLLVAGAPASAAPPNPPAPLYGSASKGALAGRYIVVLKNRAGLAAATAKANQPGSRVTHQYTYLLDGFAAELSAEALDAVRRDPNVSFVEFDGRTRAAGTQSNPPSWGLDRIDQFTGLDNTYRYSATGEGVTVYVVDSGVRITHDEFGGRARYGWDFVDGDADANDCNSHGTHVAGTVAGARVGVAKEAGIVAVRVLGCDGSGANSDVIDGLDWAAADAAGHRPAVVNASLTSDLPSTVVDLAVKRAVFAGFTTVLAAGNDNRDACGVTPARTLEAITVGATTVADHRAGFSNWGSCLDVFAPGEGIWSAIRDSDTALGSLDGTSMAAPHVAGLAAQALQANSGLSPDGVRAAILNASAAGLVQDPGTGSPNRYARRLGFDYQVTPNNGLTNMFHSYGDRNLDYSAQCAAWSGGDGTQSIRLPSGKRAWYFSDTFLGNPRLRPNGFDTSMIRNSAIVQNGGSLRTITGGNTCQERNSDIDFWSRYAHTPVDTPGGNEFYWTADGAVVGSNVVKFFFRNVPTPDGWWMETNTAMEVTPVSAYENNSVINESPAILPAHHPYGNHPILWGIALLEDGPYYYIYGSAAINAAKQRRLYVARTLKSQLADFGSWFFYMGNNIWSSNQAQAVPVHGSFEPTMAYSVARINGSYWLIQKTPTIDDGSIVAHPAGTPWGFTDRRVVLYTPPVGTRGPANTWQWWYDARLHLGASGDPTKAVISYNQNSTAVSIGCRTYIDHNSQVYRPRFIDVSTSAFDPDVATAPLAAAAPGAPDRRGVRTRPVPPAAATAAAGTIATDVSITANDNNWYDAWAQTAGCPPLNQPTTLGVSTTPDGQVDLSWTNYGRDMWYWIERRDVTADGPWARMELWRTSPGSIDAPITSAALNGHRFEWRIVPFASGFGGKEAPPSLPVQVTVTVARPAMPAGVTAAAVNGVPRTIQVSWNGVTYPSSSVYYSVYYWNITEGETSADASSIRFIGEHARSVWVENLFPGDRYGFYVVAENIAGASPRSATTEATA